MPSDDASNTLAHSSSRCSHRLEHIDRGEGGQQGIVALNFQPTRRQHGPGRLGTAKPAHLKLVDPVVVVQALEKPHPHAGFQAMSPGVGAAPGQPGCGRFVGVQHLMVGR